MNKLIRTAVIGVGYLGKYHADKYALLPNSQLVAVVDTDPTLCAAVASTCQTQAFSDYRELLGKVDAVSIAVPTPLHFSIARFFLENGVHVLIEKPITTTLAEAEILIQIAKQQQCVLQVGHLERFNPALAGLQTWLHQPRYIESSRLAPFKLRGTDVSVILDLMIHDIDIIQSLIPSAIRHIHASGTSILSNDIDIANARIEFMNGCVANVTASRVSDKGERTMHVFQADSHLSLDFQHATLAVYKKGPMDLATGIPEILREEFTFTNTDALLAEIKAFLFSIENQTPPVVSGEDGKRALETAIHIATLVKEPVLIPA